MINICKEILIAEKRIEAHINKTPLLRSEILSKKLDSNIFLKCEQLQKTGSFKFRGALNKILSLCSDKFQPRTVIAASTGNHGKGVALAAKIANVEAKIYVPQNITQLKLEAIKNLDAKINIVKGDCLQAEIYARKIAEERNLCFISPYNDPQVIAGQGTIGLEIIEQIKQLNIKLDAVFVTVGGGGLISGIASYIKKHFLKTKIIGCWPMNNTIMYNAIKIGKILEINEKKSISDATAGSIEKDTITLELCKELIDDSILVSEEEIIQAMYTIAECEGFIIEGAAAVAVAAFLKKAKDFIGKNVLIVICGRNISLHNFHKLLK